MKTFSQLRFLCRESCAAGFCQGIDLDAALVLQFRPLPFDPALVGETMQRGEEGARTDREDAACDLLDAVGDPNSVQRSKFERPENEQVQRALQ